MVEAADRNVVPLSGDIKPRSVPWLFQTLRVQSKTGTASFEYIEGKTALKIAKKVYFRNGDIAFASSNLTADRLGDYLLAAGKITQAQFDASTEIMLKTGKRQGAVLVEMGFISPQALVESVKDHVKQIIVSLFPPHAGTYRFDEGPLPVQDIIPLQLSTGNLILDGLATLDWKDIRKSLPAPTTVVRPATDPSALFQDANLSADQKIVLSLVDGKRTIEEVASLSGIGDFNAFKALSVLFGLRMIEEGAIKSEEEMSFAREAVQEAVRLSKARDEKQAAARPAEPEMQVTRESIQQAFETLAKQDHYQVLKVERDADVPAIKKAYFRLAKAYHPDRHFDSAMADMKDRLDTLFDRIHKAYDTLSDDVKRAEYNLMLSRQQPAAPSPAAASPASPQSGEFVEQHAEEYQENYKEKAERAAVQFNNGMRDFQVGNYWAAVDSFTWAVRLDPIKAPYFFYLGLCLSNIPRRKHEAEEHLQKAIELDATKVEHHIELSNLYLKSGIKAKSLAVLNAALEHVAWKDKLEEAIAAAGEGKLTAVLSEKTARAEEQRSAIRQKVAPAKAAEAEQQFAKGMQDYKVNNFGLAVDSFAAAARTDPSKAEYFFYHGICLLRIPRRQAEAEEPFRRAFELDASKMEYHYALGNFYLRTGHKVKGIGILNNALLRFPDAQKIKDALKAAGVAVAEQPAAEGKKSGILGKIFKK